MTNSTTNLLLAMIYLHLSQDWIGVVLVATMAISVFLRVVIARKTRLHKAAAQEDGDE